MIQDKDYDVLIYSKWCLDCDFPKEAQEIGNWVRHEGLTVRIIRTAYRPEEHGKATELWAAARDLPEEEAQDYATFVVYNDVIELKEFVKMIKECKNKMIKEGETKDDMQGLPKASRSKRKNRVATATDENNEEN